MNKPDILSYEAAAKRIVRFFVGKIKYSNESHVSVPVFGGNLQHRMERHGEEKFTFSRINLSATEYVDVPLVEDNSEKLKLTVCISKEFFRVFDDNNALSKKWNVSMIFNGDSHPVRRLFAVKYCKEFRSVEKRLAVLGLPPIDIHKWKWEEIHGKRSEIFSRKVANYFCTDSSRCKKVLELLKSKRKGTVSYDYEIRHGNGSADSYDTEWESYNEHLLKFTCKGNVLGAV